jgi:hypothetical protein
MGCCDGTDVRNLTEVVGDLPAPTVVCLAKMAYFMVCTAEYFYTGRGLTPWDDLLPAERASYTAKAAAALRGVRPQSHPTDMLFYGVLRGLVTNV